MNRDLSSIRNDFTKHVLNENEMGNEPIQIFKEWLHQAIDGNCCEPTAMTLSTVTEDGWPSARIVLLKHVEEKDGFWFYTNYNSAKGQQLSNNPHAALTFFWPELERQVRITGQVQKLSEAQNVTYFNSRPIDSQISASISPQSEVIKSRKVLEDLYQKAKESNEHIACPKHWGGYALKPFEIEFWQGRSGRLHDRIRYKLSSKQWTKKRLAP